MQYKNLNLKRDNEQKILDWNGNQIKVWRKLPIDTIYDIIMITLQKSYEDGIYNPLKLDIYFHLNLVYAYTDIEFSDEDRANEFNLYDELDSEGFFDSFLKVIDDQDYADMLCYIETLVKEKTKYNKSAASILKNFVDELPKNAEAAQKIVDNFEPEKYQAVLDFAKSANANRTV